MKYYDRLTERAFRERLCSTNVADDIYLGSFLVSDGLLPTAQGDRNPTQQNGIGPAGRIFFLNVVPAAVATATLAALQHTTALTAITLTAGANVTQTVAPDGSGSTTYQLDCARCVSLTSTANMSAQNFTLTAFDNRGRKFTSTIAGPNGNTVYFPKAAAQVLSIVASATDGANNVSAGVADVFGLPYLIANPGYIVSNKWGATLANDAGELITGDATSPATATTSDPRGLYATSSPSDGTKRLVIAYHLDAGQVGYNATPANVLGVTPV